MTIKITDSRLEIPGKISKLAFTQFKDESKENPANIVIFLTSATGVARSFYNRYAKSLCLLENINSVYTFDYQGVAESISQDGGLKSQANVSIKREWVSDTELMLQHVIKVHGLPEIVYLAHSVGGHLLGFIDEKYQKLISRALFFSVNIPYYKYYGLRDGMLWLTHTTLTPYIFGNYPAGQLGMGESLPSNVGRQWGYWSRFPNYMAHNPETEKLFSKCTIPIEAIGFSNDTIAKTNKSLVRTLAVVYKSCPSRLMYIDPKTDLGIEKNIGHFFFFKTPELWPLFHQWILFGKRTAPVGKILYISENLKSR